MFRRRHQTTFDELRQRSLRAKRPRLSLLDRALSLLRRRRPQQRKDYDSRITADEQLNTLWGNNLTYFVGSDGKSLSLAGPPLPLHKAKSLQTVTGRYLTRHMSASGKLEVDLPALAPARVSGSLPRRIGRSVWAGVKWLFMLKPRIQIIERYIWGEALGFFLMGAMAFTFFMVITTIFSFGEKIFSKNIPPFTIMKILMLSAPQFLVLAIPVAVLFSTLMAMGRLNRDNELIAMTTNGISLYRIFVPYIAVAVMSGILTYSIYEYVVPPYTRETRETLKTFWEAQVVDFIKPNMVIKAPNRKYFYVGSINKTESRMYDLRLYDYFGDDTRMREFPRMFVADVGFIENEFLVLQGVTVYELDQDRGNTLVEAKMPEVRIDIATQLSDYSLNPAPMELTASELRSRILQQRDRMAAIKYHNPQMAFTLNKDWTEYYFKFSVPLACLAFVLVAVPVSLRGPRDERNMGIILSFLLVMAYYIIFFTCREVGTRGLYMSSDLELFGMTLAQRGTNLFPPIIAGWLAPSVFATASAFMIARARR